MLAKVEADFSYVIKYFTVKSQKNKLNFMLNYSFVVKHWLTQNKSVKFIYIPCAG